MLVPASQMPGVVPASQWNQDMLASFLPFNTGPVRLDAAETVFFQRELEFIDTQDYETLEPDNLARTYIPTQPGVPDWAVTYTARIFRKFAQAKFIGNASDDLPRADADGTELSKVIKLIGASYGWDFREIRAAAKTGRRLDAMKALAARFSIEQLIDRTLALGNTAQGMDGLLTLDPTVNIITPGDKSGGGTSWDNATADEIAADIFQMGTSIVVALKQAGAPLFRQLTVLLPIEKHALISQKRMGDGSNMTVLRFVIENSPYIVAIEPWRFCDDAGAGGATRMVAYPRNPLVVAGLIPMETQSMAPMQKNLEFVVNMVASCGGVFLRYAMAMLYMDGI